MIQMIILDVHHSSKLINFVKPNEYLNELDGDKKETNIILKKKRDYKFWK